MMKKIFGQLHRWRFAWGIGAGLTDRLQLMKLSLQHVLVNRGLARYSPKVHEINIGYAGRRARVRLRENGTDIIIFEDVFDTGCYALTDVTAPRCIADAGGNIGLASLYFSLRYPEARIVTFEPVEHELCRQNIGQVRALALGREAGELNILVDPCNSGGHRLELYDSNPDLKRIKVRVERLDTLIDTGEMPAPDWLKVDAEGAECDIVEGLGRHLNELQVLVAEIQSMRNHTWMMDRLTQHGFARIEERILHPEADQPHESYSIIIARR